MNKKDTKQVSIRFPIDLFAWIASQAKEHNRSFNAQVIWMLRSYIKSQEKREQ
jgi:hypothetical protein